MKAISILIFCSILATSIFAQSQNKISAKTNFLGWYDFKEDGKWIKRKRVNEIFKSDVRAHSYYKSSQSNAIMANIMAGAGGFVFGWQVGNILRDQNTSLQFLAGGLGLSILSLLPKGAAHRSMEKAINLINGNEIGKGSKKTYRSHDLVLGKD